MQTEKFCLQHTFFNPVGNTSNMRFKLCTRVEQVSFDFSVSLLVDCENKLEGTDSSDCSSSNVGVWIDAGSFSVSWLETEARAMLEACLATGETRLRVENFLPSRVVLRGAWWVGSRGIGNDSSRWPCRRWIRWKMDACQSTHIYKHKIIATIKRLVNKKKFTTVFTHYSNRTILIFHLRCVMYST